MKLISMTDFVLNETNRPTTLSDSFQKCVTYAKFLKQPLKLGMFVPCDEDGNVLVHPNYIKGKRTARVYNDRMDIYQKAKERVLFKGIDLDTAKFHCNRNDRTIEYFTSFEVELTPSAIKNIFG